MSAVFVQSAPQLGNQYRDDAFLRSYLQRKIPAATLSAIAPELDSGLMRLAFVFALVGYGTKAGLAPFHTWLPDAYSQAPGPVGAVLGGAKLAVAIYALARFQLIAAQTNSAVMPLCSDGIAEMPPPSATPSEPYSESRCAW